MKTETNNTYQFENLSTASRVTRVVIAAAFIGSVIMASGPIGGLAVLPLLSIYLVFTAMISWDPVSALFSHEQRGAVRLSTSLRAGYGILGSTLIGIAMTSAAPLGLVAILPLAAIYPAFGAITGIDPLDALINAGNIQDEETVEETAVKGSLHLFASPQKEVDALHHHDQAA